MPYDTDLAARVRTMFARRKGVTEMTLFGCVGWLLNGHVCVGVWKAGLIARVGADDYETSLREPHTRPFDITGTPMTGWVVVGPAGVATDDQLRAWVDRCAAFVRTLPKKR